MHADSNLTNSFNVIRAIDPGLYRRMSDANWRVLGFIDRDLAGQGYGVTGVLAKPVSAYGIAAGTALTELDTFSINKFASEKGINPVVFAADVLVHEFFHTPDGGQPADTPPGPAAERPAFAAGTAFAHKLPAPDGPIIAELSDSTLKEVEGMAW